MTGPPTIRQVDFSEFHDLFHPLWACRGYPGGWRRHVSLTWEYRVRPALLKQTACRVGRHYPVQWFSQHGSGTSCLYCGKKRP